MASTRRATSGAPRRQGRSPAPPASPSPSRPSHRLGAPAASPTSGLQPLSGEWLSLTDLGRVYGVSAVHTGKLLQAAGLRLADGDPSPSALAAGLAQRQHSGQHRQALWHRQGCAPHLEGQGLMPQGQRNLVGLWADLLAALQQGSPGIATSAEEMAGDIPGELVQPVNRELRERGCDFQVPGGLSPRGASRPGLRPESQSAA
jgi:hypothetical protein